MVDFKFDTPHDIMRRITFSEREKRLSLNLSQQSLSEQSGVSLGVLKKFERTGKISLESLLKLAFVLGSLSEFGELFKSAQTETLLTLDELISQKTRQRGRR